ncbi:Ankyrin repeat family protein [Rhynchospora pubera]|uniref:Ankyrin repeat family protein n=1 Tax=Rhynchospora pubera TaxID=906938 RepID=A0AAV8HLY1_9POAL|nr:Ankyrin repeat family protein [Rhynchospora pubera]KAJ4816646.1 Ankyrin repeat family protein [Rhynchospora pubera]
MSHESPHNSNNTQPNNPTSEQSEILQPTISTPIPTRQQANHDSANRKMFHKIQGSLMIVAVLAAGATYQAGLNPPGGFWQANDDQGHIAGNPVLHDTFSRRYTAFFYCNATAFITSLVIIILLMNIEFYNNPRMITVLQITMVLDLFGFLGAYAAGSCRELSSSIYLFLLMGGVFIYVLSFARHYGVVHNFASRTPCLKPCLTDPV